MPLPRRQYTRELKLNAIHLVVTEGRRSCEVADELGIGRTTLYAWLHDYRNGKIQDTDDSGHQISPEKEENTRLRALLAKKDREILLLKKFAAYLSKEGLK